MKNKGYVRNFIYYCLLIIITLVFAAPFILMISMSLASDSTNAKGLYSLFPKEFVWSNYLRVFDEKYNMGLYIWNSIKLVFWCVIGQLAGSTVVAYSFARLRARWKSLLFILLLSTMMIPQDIYNVPQFILFQKLGWINTYLPLIIPNFCGGAFNIFLLRQFFMSIPRTLDDAAKIDGLGYPGTFFYILLPLLKPVLIAVALFTFQYNWGWFYGPLVFIQEKSKYPLAVALQFLQSSQGNAVPNWHYIMVGSMFLTLPPLLIYFFGQKYILEANISAGSASLK